MRQEDLTGSREEIVSDTQPPFLFDAEDGAVFTSLVTSRDRSVIETPQSIHAFSLAKFVSFELSLVKEVETVLTAKRGRLFYLWVVIDDFDEAVRKRIYAREMEIIDEFREYDFDFNIISRRGRSLEDLICDPDLKVTFHRALRGLQDDDANPC